MGAAGPRNTEPAPIDRAALQRCLVPFHEARTLPAAAYLDPAVFSWELEHFFESSWLCIGRGADRELRAFFNTCRHRGHELLPCGGAAVNNRVVQCPYHRWTYDLDGAFRGGPGMASQQSFERSDPEHGL